MKKLCLLLLLCFLSVTTALADSPRFDNMRTVVIADTTQDSYAARFMKSRLKQPFRIPYWDRIETDTALSPSDVNIDTLRTLAAQVLHECEQKHITDWAAIKGSVKNELSMFLYKKTHRNPMILPVIMEV